MLQIIDPEKIQAQAAAEDVEPFEILRRVLDELNRKSWEQFQEAGECNAR